MNEEKHIKISVADPSALGLFGLAIITLIASASKFGWIDGTALIIPWAFFLGGALQLIASRYDFKHNNVFGATAFGAYGVFWICIGMTWMIQSLGFGINPALLDSKTLGFAYLGYLIFTIFMTIGAMETNKVLFIIFVLIDILFIGLTLSTFGILHDLTHNIAAIAELLIAIVSFYGVGANVLNKTFNKTFLPLGKPFGIFKK